MSSTFPTLRSVVLDATDARRLADFYRQLLGYEYRPGDEPPVEGAPDPKGRDWLVLIDPAGRARLAFQRVDDLPPTTWPEPGVPQQVHLDLSVPSRDELVVHQRRAMALGARMVLDRSDHPEEALCVDVDPSGHTFCLFVAPPP